MMNAISQIIRNFLCCVKDLQLGKQSIPFIYESSVVRKFSTYVFDLPHLKMTTPLELMISLSQLYACFSCIFSGYRLVTSNGVMKLLQINRFILLHIKMKTNKKQDVKYSTRSAKRKEDDAKEQSELKNQTYRIISQSLLSEANSAFQNAIVGLCTITTGFSFFWLAANSIHITETGWIGGISTLIHSLILMEIALFVLLYYMIKNGNKKIKLSNKMKIIVMKIKESGRFDNSNIIDCDCFNWLQSQKIFLPFWTSSRGKGNKDNNERSEEKKYKQIMKYITTTLFTFTRKHKTNEDNFVKAFGQTPEEISTRLLDEAKVNKWKGLCDFIYFFLNFIAFYGYLMPIICYYIYAEDKNKKKILSYFTFGYPCIQAEWVGNFVGDLMWTIEPLVMLFSPFVFSTFTSHISKHKIN